MLKYRFLILLLFSTISYNQVIVSEDIFLMGSDFDITVVAQDSSEAKFYISMAINEITRIEKLISSWDKNSETSRINKYSGINPIAVEKELFELIKRSIKISEITDGAFDISFSPSYINWKFDGTMKKLPSSEIISQSVSNIGFNNIYLDDINKSVYLKLKGMKIGFGGIGKGYAADRAKELLVSKGVVAGVINASGDMNIWGTPPDRDSWIISITDPLNNSKSLASFAITDRAIVTSGNYQKYTIIDGVKYSHIIDPRTGYPSQGVISSTVIANSAELADALSTSIVVMGIQNGLHLVNQLPNVECILVDEDGQISVSNNIDVEVL